MLNVKRCGEPRGRVRFLSDDERTRLLGACKQSNNSYLYAIVVLALSTGARKMEILGLRWKDADLTRGIVTLHETKNGERRALPLTSLALELIKQHAKVRSLHSDYLFPSATLDKPIVIKKAWETALAHADYDKDAS